MAKRKTAVIDSRALLDAQVPESQLLKDIIDLVHYLHGLCHHCYDSRYCGPDPGLPDLLIVLFGRLIYVETKKLTGKLAKAQRDWKQRILAAGGEYYEWRPDDWSSGAIERILKRDRRAA